MQQVHFVGGEPIATFHVGVVPILSRGTPENNHCLAGESARLTNLLIAQRHLLLVPGFRCPAPSAIIKGVLFNPALVESGQLRIQPHPVSRTHRLQQGCAAHYVNRPAGTGTAAIVVNLRTAK